MTSKNYIAIDIAKDSLAVKSDCFSELFCYNTEAFKKLLVTIHAVEAPLVVCEATGGYERELMACLHDNGIAVALVNPSRVRAFARSEGLKAKTDPIDAALLLRFAQSKNLKPTPPPLPQQQTLQALMDRRSQLNESLAREKNRLQKCLQCVRKSIEKMIAIIEEELAQIDEQVKQLIAEDPLMSEQSSTMQSVVGLGKSTAWAILAYLWTCPEKVYTSEVRFS